MYRIALIIGGALLLAGAALAGTFAGLGSTSTPELSLAAATTTAATTTTRQDDRGRENEVRGRADEPGEDISGPCDEAEHANDPRCTGVPAPRVDDGVADDRGREDEVRGRADEPGEDISGPCDEAEHANDPRCSGVPAAPRADDDEVAGNRGHDDNRGHRDNSGPGSGDDDSSGHGGGGDDSGGGNSGHGGGDDD